MLFEYERTFVVGATESRVMLVETDHSVGSEFCTQTAMGLSPSVSGAEVTVETISEFAVVTVPVSTGVPLPQAAPEPAYTR